MILIIEIQALLVWRPYIKLSGIFYQNVGGKSG